VPIRPGRWPRATVNTRNPRPVRFALNKKSDTGPMQLLVAPRAREQNDLRKRWENGVRENGGKTVSGTLFISGNMRQDSVMGRVRRVDVGGMVYHAWNRANFRSRLFKTEAHCQDFLALVEESLNFVPMRILAYCLMPNHWHLRKSKSNFSARGRWPRTCEKIPQRSKAPRAEAQRRGERNQNKAVVLSESLRLCVSARDSSFFSHVPSPRITCRG
jgi:REP element-mobilizing transposase RayT